MSASTTGKGKDDDEEAAIEQWNYEQGMLF
jgi:hypothetical protein